MVVLVTGGAGYVGSALVRQLLRDSVESGETIRVLDNMFRETYVSLSELARDSRFEFMEGDVRKVEDVERAFKDVETVFHLAAITNAPLSFERRELTRQVNQIGTRNVVSQALRSSAKRFVYSSTASVYGPTKGIVTEESECRPESPYGRYKLRGEKECLRAFEKQGLKSVVLRLATVYGFSLGWRVQGIVVNRLAYLGCTGNPLTVYGTGEQKRPFIDLRDAVRALVFAATRPETVGRVFNVVGQNASVNDVVGAIRRILPRLQIVKLRGSKHLEELSYMLDDSKFRRLGFRTEHSLEDGVRQIVEEFLGAQPIVAGD